MAKPGVTREQRISEEGLERLERQLSLGIRVNAEVLKQWIRRYGDTAREILKKYNYEIDD